jgi:hypothetical protein
MGPIECLFLGVSENLKWGAGRETEKLKFWGQAMGFKWSAGRFSGSQVFSFFSPPRTQSLLVAMSGEVCVGYRGFSGSDECPDRKASLLGSHFLQVIHQN